LNAADATVRYWGCIGLGNVANQIPPANRDGAVSGLRICLKDESENVRIAAARSLCHLDYADEALPVLVAVLDDGSQWARVHAANVLDEINEQARPVIAAMQRNKAYRKGLVADGKYTVRVLNHALNELLETTETVQ
ncbi:MAG: HEAT repeat domain-containing protein, partial [Planctomycetaceae bacterium]